MVRRGKISWDDTDAIGGPNRPVRIDDLDDLDDPDWDPVLPDEDEVPGHSQNPNSQPDAEPQRTKRPRRTRENSDSRRHLAGADWLRDKTPPPQCDEE